MSFSRGLLIPGCLVIFTSGSDFPPPLNPCFHIAPSSYSAMCIPPPSPSLSRVPKKRAPVSFHSFLHHQSRPPCCLIPTILQTLHTWKPFTQCLAPATGLFCAPLRGKIFSICLSSMSPLPYIPSSYLTDAYSVKKLSGLVFSLGTPETSVSNAQVFREHDNPSHGLVSLILESLWSYFLETKNSPSPMEYVGGG